MRKFIFAAFILAIFISSFVYAEGSDANSPSQICENKCGDGICQEIVCLGTGCPCAETFDSCPEDCSNKCIAEGSKGSIISQESCCEGLTQIGNSFPSNGSCIAPTNGSFVCSKCGDGICSPWENECNCPSDCGKNDIIINLNEKFELFVSQRAILVRPEENSKIIFRLDNLYFTSCIPEDLSCKGGIYAVLTVEKNYGETGQATQLSLGEGESADIFGYTLQNLSLNEKSGTFIVKSVSNPEPVYAKLGDSFSLVELQTAIIQKGNETVMKLTLDKLTYLKIYCIKAPCEEQAYANLSASLPNGIGTGFSLRSGESKEISSEGKTYKVSFEKISGSAAYFVVSETVNEPVIYVDLGKEFSLNLNQTAKSEEAGIGITLAGIEQLACAVSNGATEPCPSGMAAKLIIFEDVYPTEVQQADVSKQSSSTATTRAGSSTSMPSYPYTYLREGQSIEKNGYKITVNSIASDGSSAKIVMEKSGTTITIKDAEINTKFDLFPMQSARILEAGQYVFSVTLNEIVYTKCYATETSTSPAVSSSGGGGSNTSNGLASTVISSQSKSAVSPIISKCIGRPYAKISLSSPPVCTGNEQGGGCSANGAEVILYEGDKQQFGNYIVRLVNLGNNSATFFTERQDIPDYIKVSLDEKFSLKKQQKAIVIGEDVAIVLNALSAACAVDSGLTSGCGWKANISVYKLYYATNQSVPYSNYNLNVGEKLELYGLEINLLDASSGSATFVVRKANSGIINVHTGEKFSLSENAAARVLEANMRIDVLGIYSLQACPMCIEGSACPPCSSIMQVEFSVSNYLFENEIIGTSVAQEAIETTVVSKASSAVAVDSSSIMPIPPMPFKTFTLQAGEEADVGDYTIKVLDVSTNSAVFLVEKKSTGIEINYKLRKGWNLFGYPGIMEGMGNNNCDSSKFSLFEFANGAFKKLSSPNPGKAYWLYNKGSECNAKGLLKKEVPLSEAGKLTPGWNFIPLLPSMGNNLMQIIEKGSCSIKAAYRYDAANRKWQDMLLSKVGLQKYLGEGIAIYSTNACTLGSAPDLEQFPALPMVN